MSRIGSVSLVCILLSVSGAAGAMAQSPAASPPAVSPPAASPPAASPSATAATAASPSATSTVAADRIDLPAGWQPEGVTTDGTALYVGSLADGAIWRGDPATGTGDVFIPGADGAVAVGLDHDSTNGKLWVAGGDTGEVRVYDAMSGDPLTTYPVEDAGFLNDVTVTQDAAYVTDSSAPSLVVIPIGSDGSLAAPEEVTRLELGGAYEHVPDSFNLNGIVAASDMLLAVQSASGTLYAIDPATGEAMVVDTGDYALTNGDGIEMDDGTLYVVRNQSNLVAVLDAADDLSSAALRTELTSPDLDVPTTGALVADALWVANARFGTTPGPDTEYWLTRLPLADDAG
jgi:sugar lactone lactonase YvrE